MVAATSTLVGGQAQAAGASLLQVTRALKDWIAEFCDEDLVGIADPALLEDAPAKHRPSDLLPGVRSVVVFGRRLTDGAVQSGMRRFEDNNVPAQSSYAAFAADLAPNYLMMRDAFHIAQHIERSCGEVAAAMPFNSHQSAAVDVMPMPFWLDPYGAGLPFDNNRAAVAAGLGQFGWSHQLLTPEYGPRVEFACVLTTMQLAFDAPYAGPDLCDPAACGVCADICPTGAIKACGECEPCEMGVAGAMVQASDLNRNSCIVAECAMRKEFAGRVPVKDLVDTYAPTDEELAEAYSQKAFQSLSLEHFPRYFCDRCRIYCPVGNWESRFSELGLSEGLRALASKKDEDMIAKAAARETDPSASAVADAAKATARAACAAEPAAVKA